MKIYLAGGMRDNWQDRVATLLTQHELLDPRTHGLDSPAAYTAWDLAAVRAADVVLAYMPASNPSGFGLSVEIGYAAALGKEIIFVDQLAGDPRARHFDMVRVLARATYSSLEAACADLVCK